jgi:hypothetical protein
LLSVIAVTAWESPVVRSSRDCAAIVHPSAALRNWSGWPLGRLVVAGHAVRGVEDLREVVPGVLQGGLLAGERAGRGVDVRRGDVDLRTHRALIVETVMKETQPASRREPSLPRLGGRWRSRARWGIW